MISSQDWETFMVYFPVPGEYWYHKASNGEVDMILFEYSCSYQSIFF